MAKRTEWTTKMGEIYYNAGGAKLVRQSAESRIIAVIGTFDLLHRGHIDLLQKAKALDGSLVVIMPTDESIKEPHRPFNMDRFNIVKQLRQVDWVIGMDATSPYKVLEELRPEIVVTMQESVSEINEPIMDIINKYGQLVIIPKTYNISTTDIAIKIVDYAQVLLKEKESEECNALIKEYDDDTK